MSPSASPVESFGSLRESDSHFAPPDVIIDEATPSSVDRCNMDPENEIQLTENATIVLQRRYLQKDAQGKVIESPGEMFRRVANFIARADGNYGADDSQIEETAEGFLDSCQSLRREKKRRSGGKVLHA